RIHDGLPPRQLSDEGLPGIREGDDRGRQIRAVLVGDDFDVLAFHDGNHGVRGAEVDSDDLAHGGLRCSAEGMRKPHRHRVNAGRSSRGRTARHRRAAKRLHLADPTKGGPLWPRSTKLRCATPPWGSKGTAMTWQS